MVLPLRLDSPVQFLKGVGERRAEALARLGIRTAGDLLRHVPFRYHDATTVTPIARARPGTEVTVIARVASAAVVPTRSGLRIFQAVLLDETGMIECAWPGQPFLERQISRGTLLLATGPVRHFYPGRRPRSAGAHGRQLQPREWVILGGPDDAPPERGAVLPVYPATEGVSVRLIRSLFDRHLDALLEAAVEDLPAAWREAAGVVGLRDAYRMVHRPAALAEAETGRRRLAFSELLLLQMVLARARWLAKRSRRGIRFEVTGALTTALKERLPFALTRAQRSSIREIVADMTSPVRMHRLLAGEVGSGKTVVALFAMLLAAENGYQAALMAPTEILAEQHLATLSRLLAPLGVVPEVLLGRMSAAEKAEVRLRLAGGGALQGESRIVVGTHALIQESVQFGRLGLVVIDEQHRFGVEQRAALVSKGESTVEGPDVLLLSATPIPRTLALALYGDLDLSRLDEVPAGRGRVETVIRREAERGAVYEFVAAEVRAGHQAYVIYPVIEETERGDLKAAVQMAARLTRDVFPGVEVGLVHGRLSAEERDRVMRRFRAGEVSVLVATTVVEVGIDVPNATVMLIEHPERFGLAQLHQLRGRVGRGAALSHCILIADEDAADVNAALMPYRSSGSPPARRALGRLSNFATTTDGFRIAELDLAERGHGELVGARQAGAVRLRHVDFAADADLVAVAHRLAREAIARDPALLAPALAPLVAEIGRRFERGLELFRAP